MSTWTPPLEETQDPRDKAFFTMQLLDTDSLIAMAKTSTGWLATAVRALLADRGVNTSGTWVGPAKAQKIWGTRFWDMPSGRWVSVPD